MSAAGEVKKLEAMIEVNWLEWPPELLSKATFAVLSLKEVDLNKQPASYEAALKSAARYVAEFEAALNAWKDGK